MKQKHTQCKKEIEKKNMKELEIAIRRKSWESMKKGGRKKKGKRKGGKWRDLLPGNKGRI